MNVMLSLETVSFLSDADADELKAAFEVGSVHANAVNKHVISSICLQTY